MTWPVSYIISHLKWMFQSKWTKKIALVCSVRLTILMISWWLSPWSVLIYHAPVAPLSLGSQSLLTGHLSWEKTPCNRGYCFSYYLHLLYGQSSTFFRRVCKWYNGSKQLLNTRGTTECPDPIALKALKNLARLLKGWQNSSRSFVKPWPAFRPPLTAR